MKNEVVITGLSIISSLGLSLEENWNNLLKGKSGIKNIKLFDASKLETQIAGELPNTFEEYAALLIKKRMAKQMTRVSKMCLVCAKDAMTMSGVEPNLYNKKRCAVILGVVNTGNSSVEKGTNIQNTVLKSMSNSMSAWISLDFGFEGPNYTVTTACASSSYAIAQGYDLIKNGEADIVIVGGADSIINPEEISGFNALYALSTENKFPEKASKPFSADRDGFVIGEGAGILILENKETAQKRNATIYAKMSGYGLSSEAFNIMSPKTDGEGMAYTMEKALKNSNVKKVDINYINAHGTSTTLNDLYETKAIKAVFGELAKSIPVNSSKSMIGHTIGAAGAIEAVVTVMSIRNNMIHPTINLVNADKELDLDYVPEGVRKQEVNYAISNSFGFGGHNSTLVFEKHI